MASKSRTRRVQDLNDIQTFVAAAEAGTLSGAAGDLHLPTSTVSRSLTRLEKRIGLLLVRRSQKVLALTDVGREYLLSCKGALRKLREGDDLLELHRANPGGVLRVECPVTMARDVLAPLLGQFVDANPNLRVTIDVYSSGYNLELKKRLMFSSRSEAQRTRRGAFVCIRAHSAGCSPAPAMYPNSGLRPTLPNSPHIAALAPRLGNSFIPGRSARV
jgi:DNA-binding transcriptional LysR family regulator